MTNSGLTQRDDTVNGKVESFTCATIEHDRRTTEAFPTFETNLNQQEEMERYHRSMDIPTSRTFSFSPDLSLFNRSATLDTPLPSHDIHIHKDEALQLLSVAYATAIDDFQLDHPHPGFNPAICQFSYLHNEIRQYINATHRFTPGLVRSAPPKQIRDELKTWLRLSLAEYACKSDDGVAKSSTTGLPLDIMYHLQRCANAESWEAPTLVGDLLDEMSEWISDTALLTIWDSWMEMLEDYLRLCALKHQQRAISLWA